MKKLNTLLTLAIVTLLSLSFTSCDEDANVAYYLDGTWTGNMYVQSSYDGQTYTSTYSEITFNAGYDSGDGVWVDYYTNGHWGRQDYVANHIYWRVRDRNIYVHFVEENTDVVIYNYSLGDRYFTGQVDAGGSYANFRLTRTYSSNWDDYDWGYWGYNNTHSTDFQAESTRSKDTTPTNTDVPKVIRRFVKE